MAIKGSRFIVTLGPVNDEKEAREILANVRDEMPDATHHCWAWRLAVPVLDRAGDDGEPSGSAGRPMLARLVGRDVVNVAAIVTRYFGGSKLGVGGLVRAYGGAVGEALDQTELVDYRVMTVIEIHHDYAFDRAIAGIIVESGGRSLDTRFGAQVVRTVSIPADRLRPFVVAIADASAGQALIVDPTGGN